MTQRPSMLPHPSGSVTIAALAALLVGAAAYLTLRSGGALAFPSGLGLGAPAALAGSLPSFLHTFAFALLSAVALGLERRTLAPCAAAWAVVGTAFELLQHDAVAAFVLPAPALLAADGLGAAVGALVSRYAHLGVFDPLDVLATLLGAAAAWAFGVAVLARAARRAGMGSDR